MFLGFYTSNITKKNQLTFPNKFKRNTGQKLLLAKWFEKSVIVLPENIGEEIIQSILKETSALLPEVRDLERFFYGSAVTVTLDAKNRFVLPVALRQYIETKSKVVFVGVGSRIELWDEAVYQNYGKMRELQIRDTAIRHFNRITMRKEHDEDI
jgi:MraZ protein